jgi:membrane-associated phospholipid phosphatase
MRFPSSRRFPLLLTLVVVWLCLSSLACAQCLSNTNHELRQDGSWLWRGIVEAPRNVIRPRNLKWELPIVAATGVLIATGDTPASRLIQNPSLQRQANRWSNIGLWTEFGGVGTAYVLGCAKHHESVRSTGQAALEAAAAASMFDQVLKRVTNRERPLRDNSSGEYWEGGSSFASGHAAASFAIASVVAHRYPHKRWLKWGVYGLAAGVSLARYPAKEHFFSDILIGGTLGYVTGTYLASPHGDMR